MMPSCTMTSSLNDIVTAISPTIPPTLISPRALAAIGAVAKHFPTTLGNTIGFECPLSTGTAEADFFLRVSGTWGQSLLAGKSQPPPILDQLRLEADSYPPEFERLWTHPVWQRIRYLAQSWSEPTSLLHKAIEDIWLEFDIASDVEDIPLPSSFFGIQFPGIPSLEWVSQVALPTLLGAPISAATATTLKNCFANIPTSAKPFQVGLLSGRAATETAMPAIRLYIQNLQLSQLRLTLSRLAWPGDVDLLAQVLTRVCQGKGHFSLQLEIRDRLSPVIALECYFRDRTEWQKVLNRLMTTHFCSPEFAQALMDYPGFIRAKDSFVPFPDLFRHWSNQLFPYRECLLVKRLAYLKFTYQPGHPLLAKAYLGVSPTWVDARYLDLQDSGVAATAEKESMAIELCKAIIQQVGYGEIDVDALFPCQRSQKSRWLNQALELMCVGG